MEVNSFTKIYRSVKNLLEYKPPDTPSLFVLGEEEYQEDQSPAALETRSLQNDVQELGALLRYARRLTPVMEKAADRLRGGGPEVAGINEEVRSLQKQMIELEPILLEYYGNDGVAPIRPVSASLQENTETLNVIYGLPANRDIVMRHFVVAVNPPVKAMLVYMDGISDKKLINRAVLEPLMQPQFVQHDIYDKDMVETIITRYLPNAQASPARGFQEVQGGINGGDSVLFLEGAPEAIIVETKGWEHRSVEKPTFEQSVRGSQEAFSEVLRVNTALIRSILRSSDLVTEMITIGSRSRLTCAVMYLKSVANPKLVEELKRRINGISTDFITDTAILEQFIEDAPHNIFPVSVSTERPDRVASHLVEGGVSILLDNNPFVHLVPVSLFTLFHTPEDYIFKNPYGTMMRIMRLIGAMLALLLPAMFYALSTFHPEALPTDLLLTIASARELVPFPTIGEIMLMEVSWELIREGGLRIPGVLGPTVGVVGGIILGQAAVAADIVSPITVVVISVTGLSSFAIPEYRLAVAVRIMRFFFLALAVAMGLVGVGIGVLLISVMLCNIKSFGVPYLTPVAPKTMANLDIISRGPVYRQENRPDAFNPQDISRQPHISRTWMNKKPTGKDDK